MTDLGWVVHVEVEQCINVVAASASPVSVSPPSPSPEPPGSQPMETDAPTASIEIVLIHMAAVCEEVSWRASAESVWGQGAR